MIHPTPLTLGELLADVAETSAPWAKQPVRGLAADSRMVRPGDVFFAVRGGQRHGLEFLNTVQSSGALAVLWEPPWDGALPVSDIPLVAIPRLREQLGRIASRFYGEPSRQLSVVGITGTDGKTSCAHFLAQALSDADAGPCGILGTLGVGVHGQTAPTLHTTPDALAVQHWLATLVADGRRHAVMEVSSHALDQSRVNGVEFAAAALTHLTRDHLDYHGTLEAYAIAKRRLFIEHRPEWAVLNSDDTFGQRLATDAQLHSRVITYGLGRRSTSAKHWVWGENLTLMATGLHLHIHSSWGDGLLQAQLLGRFNASNLLATLATLLALDIPLAEALTRLAQTATVPGRMERLGGEPGQPLAVIDYAHTPHALEQVLRALREHGGNSRLWCVFGCGGDRDSGKRPLMGAVAEQLSDRVIVTDDNPRTEPGERIIEDILAGMRHPHAAILIRDRRTAILHALAEAEAGDMVLIAGKGDENYQIIGMERLPFSDRVVAREFLLSTQREAA